MSKQLSLFDIPKARKSHPSGYPPEWHTGEIQKEVKRLANHQCEECGMEFHTNSNKALHEVNIDGKPVIGTVHHIDNNKLNCELSNLVYLCQRCHLHVQWQWRPGWQVPPKWRNNIPKWVTDRNLPYKPYPTKSIFGDE